MAHNFHDINGWLIVGLEGHNGFHIFPPAPMWFWKLTLLHPFTLGDKQKPTVLFNGVPSVAHQHEPAFLWPHLGVIPDPLDALTPLHILFGSHKCWLPRGAVEICGEKATCCVIGGPVSLNADCWEFGKWPTSLVLNPGTVQTTPTFGDFAMGALTLAVDLVIDLAFEFALKLGGPLVKKFADDLMAPLFKKGDDVLGDGLKAAAKNSDEAAGEAAEKGAKDAADKGASALPNGKCTTAGHPVDVTSGRVIDSKVDFLLPGAIPVRWERHYSSARALERTALGRGGWTHGLEQWVERSDQRIVFRDREGRDVYFRSIDAGESVFHRMDRLTLTALPDGGFTIYSHGSRLTRHFAPAAPGGRALLRRITDVHGNVVVLEYDGERLRQVNDTAGRIVRLTRTHGGRIARVEVWVHGRLEQWVDYAYTKMGELARAADALGHAEHYEYDEDHRMTKTTLKNGVSFYYEYDASTGWCRRTWGDGGLYPVEIAPDLERRVTVLTGNDEPRILHWNEDGLVVREETPDGTLVRTFEYDSDQYLLAETNGTGETKRYVYDARGNRVRQTDAAGNVTAWEYEDDLPSLRVGPDGLSTRFEHGAGGVLRQITYPSRLTYWLEHDERGHLVMVRTSEGPVAAYVFDGQHNVIAEIDARGARTDYRHDALGRPLVQVDALGRRTTVTYDVLGRPASLQQPDGALTRWEYDPLGNPVRSTDALGQVTRMEYGGTGVITRLTKPDGEAWRFEYSGMERLLRVLNPRGEAYEFSYDTAGRVTSERPFDGREILYRHTPSGRLLRADYGDGTYRAFSHDVLGNLVHEDSPDGSIVVERDRLGRLIQATLEEDGRRVTTRFERDALGRVVAETQGDRTLRFAYDARDLRTARVMPDGATTRYFHDLAGALAGVEHDGRRLRITRDAVGREVARDEGRGRFSIQRSYDAVDRIVEQRVDVPTPGGQAPLIAMRRLWQYDAVGRARRVEDTRWGATDYLYDAAGQLAQVGHGPYREVFTYDAAGALSRMVEGLDAARADVEGSTWNIAPGNLLVRTDRARYTYDRRGRRIQRQELRRGAPGDVVSYVWDCRDRLREVRLPGGAIVRFVYDAFGRRVRKESHPGDEGEGRATEFVWDGDTLAAEVDSRRGARAFVHEPRTFVALFQIEAGEVLTYVNDHLGAPTELIDEEGRVAWSARRSAWGRTAEVYQAPGRERPVSSPFRLLGQYADEETGLCSTRFRYFDPEVGRWCSPDPIGLRGGLDVFGFVNPATEVDPLGLASFLEIGTMASLTGRAHVGDNLDAHELLQNAWLVEHDISTGRSSTIGSQNPAIAVPTNRRPGIHQTVGQLQAANGLNDPANLARMTAQQNIDVNADLLRQAMIQHGVAPDVADAKVAELRANAEAFADTHVPACRR